MTNDEIKSIIEQNNYKLLGEILINDEQYEELFNHVFKTVDRIVNSRMKTEGIVDDLCFALGVTQIIIRNYNGSFWSDFDSALHIETNPQHQRKIGKLFLLTIKRNNLYSINDDTSDSLKYAESIKAHAFVTNNYMDGWFDFWYSYYENALLRIIDEFGDTDIRAISEYMKTTLDGNQNEVSDNIKTKKAYRLLRSTKRVLAECSSPAVRDLIEITLQMIDHYINDYKLPNRSIGRFEYEFINWCNRKADKVDRSAGRKTHRIRSSAPYLFTDLQSEKTYVIIPKQRFLKSDITGSEECVIHCGNTMLRQELDLTKNEFFYTSREERIEIPDFFERIETEISLKSKTVFRKLDYRLFDESGYMLKSLKTGKVMLLVKKGAAFSINNGSELTDEIYYCDNWDIKYISVSESTVISVGSSSISVNGITASEPDYSLLVSNYEIYDLNDQKLPVCSAHPMIYFSASRKQLNNKTILEINGKKHFGDEFLQYIQFDDGGDDDKESIAELDIGTVIEPDDDVYNVFFDIPGKGNKHICKYVILNGLSVTPKKRRYSYGDDATITIRGASATTTDDSIHSYTDSDGDISFTIKNVSADKETISFRLSLGIPVTLKYTLPILKWGFSENNLRFTDKRTDIWYSDMENIIYFSLPGLNEAYVKAHTNRSPICHTERTKSGLYKADISEICRYIEDNLLNIYNVNIYDEDSTEFRLCSVIRAAHPDPYYLLIKNSEGKTEMIVNKIVGKADLYIDICEHQAEEKIISDRQVHEGINDLSELDTSKRYDIWPYMLEEELFDTKRTELYPLMNNTAKPLYNTAVFDMDDLTGWTFTVVSLKNCTKGKKHRLANDREYYLILDGKLNNNTYTGYFKAKRKSYSPHRISNSITVMIKSINDNVLTATLSSYDQNNNETLYYDKKKRILFDNRRSTILPGSNNALISEKKYEFIIKINKKLGGKQNDVQTI